VLLGQQVEADPGIRHRETARRAAGFLRSAMWDSERQVLRRRFRKEQAAIDGYAEDYAFLILGLLELFQADGDPEWLEWAITLQRRQETLFWDATAGGWFSTTGEDKTVILRVKEEYDGAEPSASAVGALNLLTLAHLTGESEYERRAGEGFAAFSTRLESQGRGLPMMAAALSTSRSVPEQIVVVGAPASPDTIALWQAAQRRYRPFATMVLVEPGVRQQRLARLMPWIGAMALRAGRPAAYVCRNFTCDAPVTRAEELA
jgi:uncharacterized protein YyaL (SSP411 family)